MKIHGIFLALYYKNLVCVCKGVFLHPLKLPIAMFIFLGIESGLIFLFFFFSFARCFVLGLLECLLCSFKGEFSLPPG